MKSATTGQRPPGPETVQPKENAAPGQPKVQVRAEADGRVALSVDDSQNGMTIRLSPETALKLATALMECAFKAPRQEVPNGG